MAYDTDTGNVTSIERMIADPGERRPTQGIAEVLLATSAR